MNRAFEIALGEYGQKEIRGRVDNPRIIQYFNDIGFNGSRLKDETAWCSAFMNWCCKTAGYEYTKKLNARSWLTIGKPAFDRRLGDIVIFWREDPNSWKGHVGFFIRETKNWIYVLGGNQGNQVKISAYSKNRLLDIRRID